MQNSLSLNSHRLIDLSEERHREELLAGGRAQAKAKRWVSTWLQGNLCVQSWGMRGIDEGEEVKGRQKPPAPRVLGCGGSPSGVSIQF